MIIESYSGWNKHHHFGFRQEWLALWLDNPHAWQQSPTLGNRQVDSLRVWLKTTGLVDATGQLTPLWQLFQQEGPDSRQGWELLWVNVVFNFPTARWYVWRLGRGSWSTTELRAKLQEDVPHLAPATVHNAILELVGLLERTPVGRELGQGLVERGRRRLVTRKGHPFPSWPAVSWALERLYQQEGRDALPLREELLWPWIIFGCEAQVMVQQLLLQPTGPFRLEGQRLLWLPTAP